MPGNYLCIKRLHAITVGNERARYCPQCARNARRRRIKVRQVKKAAGSAVNIFDAILGPARDFNPN